MAQMYTNEWHEHLYTHSPCVDLQAYTSGRHVEGQNYFYTGRGTFCTPLLPDLTDSFILFLTYLNRLLLGEDTHLAFGRRRDTSLLASVAEPVKLSELAPSCHGQEGELSSLIHTSARRHFGHWDSFFFFSRFSLWPRLCRRRERGACAANETAYKASFMLLVSLPAIAHGIESI
jgi:hypothetical protein